MLMDLPTLLQRQVAATESLASSCDRLIAELEKIHEDLPIYVIQLARTGGP